MDLRERHERILTLSRLADDWAEKTLGVEPNWGPLEGALPREWCGGFMWMRRTQQEGTTIELYKHGITRRYLNLSAGGSAYRYTGSRYVSIDVDEALEEVFDGLEEMGWARETAYDDEFVARKYATFRELGWTVIMTGSAMSRLRLEGLMGGKARPQTDSM